MRRLVVIAWACMTAWMAASDSGWTMSRTLAIGWDGKSLDGFLGPTGCRLDRTTLLDRVPAGTGDGGAGAPFAPATSALHATTARSG